MPPVEPEAPPPPLPAAEPVPETPPEPEPLPMPPAEPDLSPLPMPPPEPDLSPLPAPPTEQEQERAPTTPVGEGAASLPAIETEPWQIEESLPSDPLAAPVNEGATEDPPMATEAEAEAILGSLAELSTRSLQEEGGVSGAEEAAPPPPSPLPERQDTGQDPSTAPWLPADPLAEGEGLSEPAALTGPDVGPEGEKSFVDTWSSMRAVSDSPDVTPPPMDDETVQAPPVPVEVPLPPPVFEEDVPQPTAQTESGQDDPRTWPSMADIRQRRASMASMEAAGELPSKRKRPSMADLDEPASEGYPKGFYWAIGLVLLLLAGGGVGLWWIRTHSPPEPLPDGGKVAAVAPRADHRDYPVEAGSLGEPYRPTRPVPPAPEEGPAPEPEEEPAPEPEEEPAEDEGGEEKEPAEAAPKPKAAAPKGGGGKGHVALFKKGESLRNKGRLGDAVKAYKQALAIKPGHVASLLGLGNAYFDLGRSGDAVGVLKKAVTAGPKNAEAHLVLGMVYQEQNKAGAAAKAYKKFLKLAPRHPHAGEVQVVLDGLGK